ncbi:MAG: Gfo/Idh/MocA family oxidoreductase [Actinomycetota bacterium]|nr:Gfo/Idh/MocA family oxidoreductase [Actinomycetota bacterium]
MPADEGDFPGGPDRADLRLAIVGLGERSVLAAYAHRPGRGARVVAVVDPEPGRRAEAPGRFGADVEAVADYRDLFAGGGAPGVDAAFVLTPDGTHEDIAVGLLEAGVPVFVEKPLAITVAGCDRILATARRTGTRLYVGHNMRHMPVVLAMRQLIASGAIGAVKAIWCRHFVGHGGDFYFKDWHADRRNTTGLLLQKGAHDLDVIAWLAGGYATRVNAMGGLLVYGGSSDPQERTGQLMREWFDPEHNWPPTDLRGLNPVVDVEDLSMVHLQLDNGILASYQQCHFTPDYWRNYTVIGTGGRLENFGDMVTGAVVKVWNRRSGYRADADLVVDVPLFEGSHGGADQPLVDEFLRFVRTGGATLTTPVAARYAVAAGCAATESLRDGGRPVDVPPLDPVLEAHFTAGPAAVPTIPTQATPPTPSPSPTGDAR